MKYNLIITAGLLFWVVSASSQTVVERYGRLQVSNAHVCAEDGEQISLAGNSFFWSNWGGEYYTANTVDYLVDEMKTSIVRAAMGVATHAEPVDGSYLTNPSTQKALIETVVQRAIDRGIYVIIDWHVEGDTRAWKSEAQAFFAEMAQKYGHHPNIIYEVWNEPTHNNWHTDIRPYAVDVINSIRQYDADNLIIVGTETWSQRPDDASTNPINDPNIAYTIHFYPDDPGNGQFHRHQLRANVTTAMNNGAAVFATEWGPSDATPNPESDIWMQFLQDNKISHCMWSVNDKIEDGDWQWSIFEPGTPGNGPYSLRGPGEYLKDMMHNWPWPGVGTTCTPFNIPGRIEAENHCEHFETQNEPTTDVGGGENLGYFDAGDWVKYTVNVAAAGDYDLTLRIATQDPGKTVNFERNGVVLTTINLPHTNGWQNWQDAQATINLPAGEYDIALSTSTGGLNVNWIDLATSDPCSTQLTTISLSPANPVISIGQSVQFTATGYDQCGDQVVMNPNWSANAPNGLFTGNSTGTFTVSVSDGGVSESTSVTVEDNSNSFSLRVEAEDFTHSGDVQTENTTDTGGGQNVGWIDNGDWMAYHGIDIPSSGTYTIKYRVASLNGGGQIKFEKAGGNPVYGTINVPSTNNWQNWTTISHTVTLTAGIQDFGIAAPTGGYNINWFEISSGSSGARVEGYAEEEPEVREYDDLVLSPNPTSDILKISGLNQNTNSFKIGQILTMEGKEVSQFQFQDIKDQTLDVSTLQSGIYMIRLLGTSESKTLRFIKD